MDIPSVYKEVTTSCFATSLHTLSAICRLQWDIKKVRWKVHLYSFSGFHGRRCLYVRLLSICFSNCVAKDFPGVSERCIASVFRLTLYSFRVWNKWKRTAEYIAKFGGNLAIHSFGRPEFQQSFLYNRKFLSTNFLIILLLRHIQSTWRRRQ